MMDKQKHVVDRQKCISVANLHSAIQTATYFNECRCSINRALDCINQYIFIKINNIIDSSKLTDYKYHHKLNMTMMRFKYDIKLAS